MRLMQWPRCWPQLPEKLGRKAPFPMDQVSSCLGRRAEALACAVNSCFVCIDLHPQALMLLQQAGSGSTLSNG